MWFDPYKALSGIEAAPPATTAIIARNQAKKAYGLAEIADLAGVAFPEQKTALLVAPPPPLSAKPEPRPEIFKYGLSFAGKPKTWTGCIVSPETWAGLSDWQKHGPDGRHWSGITKTWEMPDESWNSADSLIRTRLY